jgi:hypothetical protein
MVYSYVKKEHERIMEKVTRVTKSMSDFKMSPLNYTHPLPAKTAVTAAYLVSHSGGEALHMALFRSNVEKEPR